MSVLINGTDGIDFNDGSNQSTAATPYGRKNLIINGDMRIAQRGTSVTGIASGDSYRTLDRWRSNLSSAGTWTMSQDTDVPSGQGFATSMKWDCTTANASLSAGSYAYVTQYLEGQNLQHLKKGTANAESLTLSFWVKSNKTGTYTVFLYDVDNTRLISKAYTVDTADTWEKKTITYAGDTTGALDNNNGRSLDVRFMLASGTDWSSGTLQTSWAANVTANRAVGQVNLADSTSNYINITGVQLEIGDAASDFEFVPFDMELQRCERYYQKSYNISSPPANIDTSGQEVFQIDDGALQRDGIRYRTRMRQSGSINIYNPVTGTSGEIRTNSGNNYSLGLYAGGETGLFISYSPAAGQFLSFHWTADSEL